MQSLCDVGESVEVTVDISTAPGVFYLVHPCSEQLETDYQTIRVIEAANGFFILERTLETEKAYS
ncbi:hypothetical protein [Pelagibius sp. Alg239-R121]|uniref:hypothetical protein n=1 Tax=Pelagibius sp. Alg239-R121 TaxID=2993448 RepID=UPI0024A780F5|nr:hypothetical protein [Pelagibius sp. Alg239-R121]